MLRHADPERPRERQRRAHAGLEPAQPGRVQAGGRGGLAAVAAAALVPVRLRGGLRRQLHEQVERPEQRIDAADADAVGIGLRRGLVERDVQDLRQADDEVGQGAGLGGRRLVLIKEIDDERAQRLLLQPLHEGLVRRRDREDLLDRARQRQVVETRRAQEIGHDLGRQRVRSGLGDVGQGGGGEVADVAALSREGQLAGERLGLRARGALAQLPQQPDRREADVLVLGAELAGQARHGRGIAALGQGVRRVERDVGAAVLSRLLQQHVGGVRRRLREGEQRHLAHARVHVVEPGLGQVQGRVRGLEVEQRHRRLAAHEPGLVLERLPQRRQGLGRPRGEHLARLGGGGVADGGPRLGRGLGVVGQAVAQALLRLAAGHVGGAINLVLELHDVLVAVDPAERADLRFARHPGKAGKKR